MGTKLGYMTALLVSAPAAASIAVAPLVAADPGTTPTCTGPQIPVIDGCIAAGPQGSPANPGNGLPFEDSPAGRVPGFDPLVPWGVPP